MKIASSSISMSSQSSQVLQHTEAESLKSWVGNERPDFEGNKSNTPNSMNLSSVKLDLSDQAKALLAKAKDLLTKGATSTSSLDQGDDNTYDLSDKEKTKIQMLEDFISAIMHKRIKLIIPDKLKLKGDNSNIASGDKIVNNSGAQQPAAQAPKKQGWGSEYEYHETTHEQEKMSFSSGGTIKTTDGKEIDFSVQLNMSREFASQKDISIRAGDAVKVDPLVVNFDGNAANLTNTKFSFDLDSDGTDEQISNLSKGSGFLSLDLNNDGKINDGSELFGPKSGDGFSDLASYDKDGNNWIDENDPIFQKLRIWTKDESGNDKLFALGEKGIGAIYLGNVNTDFNIKDQSNDLQGEIKQTGIFVKENGTVGTIQHIDLAV